MIANRELHTWGRTVVVPESTSKVAKFRFEDLCGKPLCAADYIEVTKTFGTVFLLDVPKMGLDLKDKACCTSNFSFVGPLIQRTPLGTTIHHIH